MSAENQLRDAYKEWRRLAEVEGDAIRSGNWQLLADSQLALQKLQPQILDNIQQARNEWALLGADVAAREDAFRAMVSELVAIERRNSADLNAARHLTQLRLNEVEQAGRTLRQVHRSYAPQNRSGWSSFS